MRFSLAARDDAEIYDLALKVLHLQAPAGRQFHFSFELADRPAHDAANWVLDPNPSPSPNPYPYPYPNPNSTDTLTHTLFLPSVVGGTVANPDQVLDEVQRHKLTELQALLGLSDSLWTPVGVLGFVLTLTPTWTTG